MADFRNSVMANPNVQSPFPDSPRIIYGRNPLGQVICQLRFPSILRIAAEPPVAFQEQIRSEYPVLRERRTEVDLPPGIPPAVAQIVRGLPRKNAGGYDFISEDGKWKVSLAGEFLALTAGRYEQWEHLHQHLAGPLKALIDVYKPAFFTRAGLRYQNVICRTKLGLRADTAWSELIRPHIAGVLAKKEVAGIVEEFQCQTALALGAHGGHVRMMTGIVETADVPREACFLIDNDFYTQGRVTIDDVDRVLGYLNRQSGRLFRWCIEERLHVAMEPRLVEASV